MIRIAKSLICMHAHRKAIMGACAPFRGLETDNRVEIIEIVDVGLFSCHFRRFLEHVLKMCFGICLLLFLL